MVNKRLFRLMLLVSSLSFLATLLLYPGMPARVPTTWNLYGVVTAYGPKWMNLFFAAIPALCTLGLWCLPHIDPRKKNFKKHPRAYSVICAIIVFVLTALSWAIVLPALGIPLPVEKVIMALVGLMLLGMGNYMPQVRSNFFMGFRTPWTLSDDVVWRKTHRAGGIVFYISGVLFILAIFLPPFLAILLPMMVLLGGCITVFIYSYSLYKKRHRNT